MNITHTWHVNCIYSCELNKRMHQQTRVMATFESALSSYLRSTRHSSKIEPQTNPLTLNRLNAQSSERAYAEMGRVHLAVNTYRRMQSRSTAEELGQAKLVIEPPAVAVITKLESRLHELNQADISMPIKPTDMTLSMPVHCGPLEKFTLCLTTREDTEQSYLHFIARRSSDFALVYSDSVSVDSVTGQQRAA